MFFLCKEKSTTFRRLGYLKRTLAFFLWSNETIDSQQSSEYSCSDSTLSGGIISNKKKNIYNNNI